MSKKKTRNNKDPRILNVNVPKATSFNLQEAQNLYFYWIRYADKLVSSYQDSDKTKGVKLNAIFRLCETIRDAMKVHPDIQHLHELVERLEAIETEYNIARKSGLLTQRTTAN